MTKTLIYVKATNDVNGNPRRGWIVTWMDNKFVNEGYAGRRALYSALDMDHTDDREARLELDRSVNEITLNITVSEYNELKRGGA